MRLALAKALKPAQLFAAIFTLAGPLASAQDIEFEPRGDLVFDQATGEIVAEQGGMLIYGEWLLSADYIRYHQESGAATARGNVVFSNSTLRLTAASLVYRPGERFARAEDFRAGNGKYYVDGSVLEGNPDNFRFEDINFYPGEPGTFLFLARAGELTLEDQSVVRGKRLFFKVGPVPFLLIPNITQPLDAETNLFKPTLDYSGHIGAAIGAEALFPVSRHLRLGGNIALTSERGVLAGPAARYSFAEGDDSASGSLISGYINDQGDPGLDLNGEMIDTDRYFAEWRHQQFWNGNQANLSANLRYWSDSEVTRDFYEDSFQRMQDPDSFVEANFNGTNWQASLFTRAALGDFQRYTERLPELRFEYFPTALGHGFSHSGYFSAAKLQQEGLTGGTNSATKLDAFYGVEWNKPLRDGVNFRLLAGGRGLSYDDAEYYTLLYNMGDPSQTASWVGSSSGEQTFGEIGADLSLKAIATFEAKNKTWGINGIRHIFEPKLSYRYVPELSNSIVYADSEGPVLIGTYAAYESLDMRYVDSGTFASYLPAIDLADRRDTGTLREDHKIRLALNNRIQTRHKDGGSRDLARLDVSADYYLKGSLYAEEFSSLMNIDFELTPAPWLEVGFFNRLDPEDGFSNQEFNTRIAIQDPGYWRIEFGSHFLEGASANGFIPLNPNAGYTYWLGWPNYGNSWPTYGNARLEQYYTHLEYQFSENLKLYATARYDDESSVFYEQRIGIMQRALERYGLKYEIRFYDGDRREDDFGISIGIDLFDE